MENTIILGSGQKIEVLFQDEVSLDIDCALRYIESGQKEIAAYVQNTAKPQLDGVIAQAEADMAAQIAKGVADAASTASAAAAETINNSIDNANAQIEAYVAANITPDLDAALASAEEYASSAETTVNGFDEHAAALTQQAAASAAAALTSQTAASASAAAAEESADSALEAANKASFGNIGDIQYTCRTDVPNGGAWCDGAEYTQSAFPDIYQMLVDGKISSTDFTTFDSSVSTNGSCGMFALDTATTSFKVPLLKDVYIKSGQSSSMFGAESLPNITGYHAGHEDLGTRYDGCFYDDGDQGNENAVGGGGGNLHRVGFDASASSSTYQNGAKVNPDHVIYRAYVVLYASAAEASEAQAAEFINALTTKANTDLSNISSNIDYVVESYQNGTEWYRIYKSGWIEQGGYIVATPGDYTQNLLKPFADTNYTLMRTHEVKDSTVNVTVHVLGYLSKTVNSFTIYRPGQEVGSDWFACGQGE